MLNPGPATPCATHDAPAARADRRPRHAAEGRALSALRLVRAAGDHQHRRLSLHVPKRERHPPYAATVVGRNSGVPVRRDGDCMSSACASSRGTRSARRMRPRSAGGRNARGAAWQGGGFHAGQGGFALPGARARHSAPSHPAGGPARTTPGPTRCSPPRSSPPPWGAPTRTASGDGRRHGRPPAMGVDTASTESAAHAVAVAARPAATGSATGVEFVSGGMLLHRAGGHTVDRMALSRPHPGVRARLARPHVVCPCVVAEEASGPGACSLRSRRPRSTTSRS